MNESKHEIERQIMAYLRSHPEAQDTLQGIAEWWLLEQRITLAVSAVGEAIESLVRRGFVAKTEVSGHEVSYRLNAEMLREIDNFLSE